MRGYPHFTLLISLSEFFATRKKVAGKFIAFGNAALYLIVSHCQPLSLITILNFSRFNTRLRLVLTMGLEPMPPAQRLRLRYSHLNHISVLR